MRRVKMTDDDRNNLHHAVAPRYIDGRLNITEGGNVLLGVKASHLLSASNKNLLFASDARSLAIRAGLLGALIVAALIIKGGFIV
jgi:hypothetical protein